MHNLEGDAIEHRTAERLTLLAGLRKTPADIAWNGSEYTVNGKPVGRSVHGVYEFFGWK